MEFSILLYVLVGFIAQVIDGALGMAYGISSNTFLLSIGIPPASCQCQRAYGRGGHNRCIRVFTLAAGQHRLEAGQATGFSRGDRRCSGSLPAYFD